RRRRRSDKTKPPATADRPTPPGRSLPWSRRIPSSLATSTLDVMLPHAEAGTETCRTTHRDALLLNPPDVVFQIRPPTWQRGISGGPSTLVCRDWSASTDLRRPPVRVGGGSQDAIGVVKCAFVGVDASDSRPRGLFGTLPTHVELVTSVHKRVPCIVCGH